MKAISKRRPLFAHKVHKCDFGLQKYGKIQKIFSFLLKEHLNVHTLKILHKTMHVEWKISMRKSNTMQNTFKIKIKKNYKIARAMTTNNLHRKTFWHQVFKCLAFSLLQKCHFCTIKQFSNIKIYNSSTDIIQSTLLFINSIIKFQLPFTYTIYTQTLDHIHITKDAVLPIKIPISCNQLRQN